MADEDPPVSGDFAAGAQLAGYRLGEQIGWGAMAAVYRAYDVGLDRWIALKILAPEIAADQAFGQRFISEPRAAAAIGHPHIIPVFEAGQSGQVLFIAMRYVGWGDVRALVRRLGRLDVARASSIVDQGASALDAAHAAGLVHGDVKPANLLLAATARSGYPDYVYLSDFGLGRQAMSARGPTLAGHLAGTLDYPAPEQIGALPVDGRADLYALACTAYEMLAGEPPFRRGPDLGQVSGQLAGSAPPVTSLRPDLPAAIDLVLARGMATSPADRYESCLDFAASLRAAHAPERRAAGQPLAEPRVAVQLAAPVLAASPIQGVAKSPAGAHDHQAERRWSPAPPSRSALPLVAAVPASDGAGARAAEPGPGANEPAGPGQGGRAPYPRTPRWRSPVLAAAVLVVILGIASGAFLAFRDGGPSAAGHAGRTLPASTGSAGSAGGLSSSAHPSTPETGSATRPAGQASPSSPAGPSSPASPSSPAGSAGPAATVSAYIAAINGHHYATAWDLGGRNSSASYPTFVQGFGSTAQDTLTIMSVSGNVVTARLTARQTDGTVKTYQGTYTVQDGVIAKANVHQIS